MPRLVYRSLGDSVIEFDHNVTSLDALAFDDMHRHHNSRDRRGKFRAAAGMPGLRRLRFHHAVGFDPRAEIGFRHRADLHGDLGFDLLFLGDRSTAGSKRKHGHTQRCERQFLIWLHTGADNPPRTHHYAGHKRLPLHQSIALCALHSV